MLDRAFYTETLILLRWALKYKTNNIFRNVSFIYEHPIDCFPLIILIIRIFLVIKTVITFVLETWFISSVHRRELLNNSPCLHVVCFSFLCVCMWMHFFDSKPESYLFCRSLVVWFGSWWPAPWWCHRTLRAGSCLSLSSASSWPSFGRWCLPAGDTTTAAAGQQLWVTPQIGGHVN